MKRLGLIVLTVGLSSALALAQDKRVSVTFVSQNSNRDFDGAADEYRRIWAAEESG